MSLSSSDIVLLLLSKAIPAFRVKSIPFNSGVHTQVQTTSDYGLKVCTLSSAVQVMLYDGVISLRFFNIHTLRMYVRGILEQHQ